MEYSNNHYVPQFILRRFGNKINRYNVKTGDIKTKGCLLNAFSSKNIYPEWLEHMLSRLESKIANLIDNKILNTTEVVTLTRAENVLIKKFFAVATLRVPDSSLYSIKHLDSEESLKNMGFKEVHKDNESNADYVYRTLKVILESDSVEELYNHPEVTYEACKWFLMFFNCYLTIWDGSDSKEDFIITDNGMNCEHDKTRFITFNFDDKPYLNEKDEMLKCGYVMKKMLESKDDPEKLFVYAGLSQKMKYVHANYYLFAVSATRTVALINPFYRLYDDPTFSKITNEVPDVWPTLLSREAMRCNSQTYKEVGKMSEDDLFHYEIKNLSLEEVIIVNNMMLDRVYLWIGYDDSSKIVKSLNVYSMIDKQFQRKNYDKLIEHLYSMGYEFPKIKKYYDINEKLTKYLFTKEEMNYIEFFYNLIKHQ